MNKGKRTGRVKAVSLNRDGTAANVLKPNRIRIIAICRIIVLVKSAFINRQTFCPKVAVIQPNTIKCAVIKSQTLHAMSPNCRVEALIPRRRKTNAAIQNRIRKYNIGGIRDLESNEISIISGVICRIFKLNRANNVQRNTSFYSIDDIVLRGLAFLVYYFVFGLVTQIFDAAEAVSNLFIANNNTVVSQIHTVQINRQLRDARGNLRQAVELLQRQGRTVSHRDAVRPLRGVLPGDVVLTPALVGGFLRLGILPCRSVVLLRGTVLLAHGRFRRGGLGAVIRQRSGADRNGHRQRQHERRSLFIGTFSHGGFLPSKSVFRLMPLYPPPTCFCQQ